MPHENLLKPFNRLRINSSGQSFYSVCTITFWHSIYYA